MCKENCDSVAERGEIAKAVSRRELTLSWAQVEALTLVSSMAGTIIVTGEKMTVEGQWLEVVVQAHRSSLPVASIFLGK